MDPSGSHPDPLPGGDEADATGGVGCHAGGHAEVGVEGGWRVDGNDPSFGCSNPLSRRLRACAGRKARSTEPEPTLGDQHFADLAKHPRGAAAVMFFFFFFWLPFYFFFSVLMFFVVVLIFFYSLLLCGIAVVAVN